MFPDGRRVVSGSGDETHKLWEVPPAAPGRVLPPGMMEVVGKWDFAADRPGDLDFKKGDVILTDAAAFAAAGDSGGWISGELNGKQGAFPSNYCAPK